MKINAEIFAPTILVPRSSVSEEFLELALGKLTVSNAHEISKVKKFHVIEKF